MGGAFAADRRGVTLQGVALLAIAVFINYVDRGNLATPARSSRASGG